LGSSRGGQSNAFFLTPFVSPLLHEGVSQTTVVRTSVIFRAQEFVEADENEVRKGAFVIMETFCMIHKKGKMGEHCACV
jgi:hypothetical protein